MEYLKSGLERLSNKIIDSSNKNTLILMHQACMLVDNDCIGFKSLAATEGLFCDPVDINEFSKSIDVPKGSIYASRLSTINKIKEMIHSMSTVNSVNDIINVNINKDEYHIDLLMLTKCVDTAVLNRAKQVGILTIGDLKNISMNEASLLHGIGETTIMRLRDSLKSIGADFRDDQLRFYFFDNEVPDSEMTIGI